MAVLLAFLPPEDCQGQFTGVLGLDGVISKRQEKAFGAGLTLTYGHSALMTRKPGFTVALKAMGLADAEIVTGELTSSDICIDYDSDPHYYRRPCDPNGNAVPPELAEAPSPARGYLGAYALLDVWRARLGVGLTGHPGSGDAGASFLLGLAATTTSWVMVELPQSDGWRLRLEASLAGAEYFWR